jgi:hypothetical protein
VESALTEKKKNRVCTVLFGPHPVPAFVIRDLFTKLPEDTVMISHIQDFTRAQWGWVIASDSFAEVPEGGVIPKMVFKVDGVKKQIELTMPVMPENFMDELEGL